MPRNAKKKEKEKQDTEQKKNTASKSVNKFKAPKSKEKV